MHKWTDQECEIVCKVFRDEFVNSYNSVEAAVFFCNSFSRKFATKFQ